MKSNEFRLGNLVNFLERVIVVSQPDIENMVRMEFAEGVISELYQPILLTEEWLLKLGFERTYNSQFRLKYNLPCDFIGFDISKTEEKSMEGFRYFGHYIKIKYVHQLQNLYFALTGQELTFKNQFINK